jgi:hypothetical protein
LWHHGLGFEGREKSKLPMEPQGEEMRRKKEREDEERERERGGLAYFAYESRRSI